MRAFRPLLPLLGAALATACAPAALPLPAVQALSFTLERSNPAEAVGVIASALPQPAGDRGKPD
ncbi:MAG: hypothetical protein JWM80_1845, partial [Cyanobacteria bacterium RYN_339]|nr:hypothetical protein [Cyanobacteria bacterium RYN_339]